MNSLLADITLPLWLIISQWVLLFALGFLVIIMYRQLGFLLRLRDLGTEREGLPLGKKAPVFEYVALNEGTQMPTRFEPTGGWSLLVFVSPGCAGCRGTIPALEELKPTLLKQGVRVLVMTTAGPVLKEEVNTLRSEIIEVSHIGKEVPDGLYDTHSTPFAYLINPEGIIQAKGVVTSEREIQKIIEKIDVHISEVESTAS